MTIYRVGDHIGNWGWNVIVRHRMKSVNHSKQQDIRAAHEAVMRSNEILQYTAELKAYEIDINRLPSLSPSKLDARVNAMKVARTILENNRLKGLFLKTKKLPIHELVEQPSVCKEVTQTYPKYITAMVLLLMKDYPHLNEWLQL